MVNAVGNSNYGMSASVQTLEGRIRQDKIQLDDWTTCVSANTPKGQTAIQKFSGDISAAKAQIGRALQSQSSAASSMLDVWA